MGLGDETGRPYGQRIEEVFEKLWFNIHNMTLIPLYPLVGASSLLCNHHHHLQNVLSSQSEPTHWTLIPHPPLSPASRLFYALSLWIWLLQGPHTRGNQTVLVHWGPAIMSSRSIHVVAGVRISFLSLRVNSPQKALTSFIYLFLAEYQWYYVKHEHCSCTSSTDEDMRVERILFTTAEKKSKYKYTYKYSIYKHRYRVSTKSL